MRRGCLVYALGEAGLVENHPESLIRDCVRQVLRVYAAACGKKTAL